MPLIVKIDSSPEQKPEMAIVELQGDLKCRTELSLDSQFIGDLYFKTQGDGHLLPVLIIGHHILTGKIQNLEKPFAVMERKRVLEESADFIVKSIVTKKIIFKTRPKPIISDH